MAARRESRGISTEPYFQDDRLSRRLMLKSAFMALGLPVFGGLLSACGSDTGPGSDSGSPQRWRIGTPAFKADSMFQNMAVELGFFEEEGIDAEIVPLESSATVARAVLSGDLEQGSCGAGTPLVAISKGSDIRLIGSLFAKVPHMMYVREDIESLEDLMGKNVGGAQPGALLQQLAYASFIEAGLDPKGVKYVNTGSSPDTFGAVVQGTVQAGVAGSEYALKLEDDPSIPVKVLFPISDRLPKFLRNADFVSTRLLSEDLDLVVRASMAYLRGAQYATKHRSEAVAWAVENADVDENVAAAIWEEYVNSDFVNLSYQISPDQLEFTQKINVETGAQDSLTAFEDVVDSRVAEKVSQ